MTGDKDDRGQSSEPPWHHSTPAVLGASAAALAVIALVVWAAVALTSSADRPEDAPTDFVPPTFVSTTSKATTSTTTQTITTTRTPITTDFGLPDETSGTSETSGSSETSETTSPLPTFPPHTRTSSADDDDYPTTRNRPRTNVTRTLYPAPGG